VVKGEEGVSALPPAAAELAPAVVVGLSPLSRRARLAGVLEESPASRRLLVESDMLERAPGRILERLEECGSEMTK
jgi:hypothetical protein